MITIIKFIIILFFIPIISCDPGSTVEYKICNMSNCDAIIELKGNVGYNIIHKDSITYHHSSERANVILKPEEALRKYLEWMNNRVEAHTPLWEEIINIKIGDSIVLPQYWNNADSWQKSSSKDMYGEEINYNLYLK